MGFPLVTVDDAHWVEGEGWVLKISQKWFLADGCQGNTSGPPYSPTFSCLLPMRREMWMLLLTSSTHCTGEVYP